MGRERASEPELSHSSHLAVPAVPRRDESVGGRGIAKLTTPAGNCRISAQILAPLRSTSTGTAGRSRVAFGVPTLSVGAPEASEGMPGQAARLGTKALGRRGRQQTKDQDALRETPTSGP